MTIVTSERKFNLALRSIGDIEATVSATKVFSVTDKKETSTENFSVTGSMKVIVGM